MHARQRAWWNEARSRSTRISSAICREQCNEPRKENDNEKTAGHNSGFATARSAVNARTDFRELGYREYKMAEYGGRWHAGRHHPRIREHNKALRIHARRSSRFLPHRFQRRDG